MIQETLHVEGMTCDHCAQTVTQAVRSLAGVRQVAVDLGAKQVSVDFDEAQVGKTEIAAKIPRINITTSSSTSVKPALERHDGRAELSIRAEGGQNLRSPSHGAG